VHSSLLPRICGKQPIAWLTRSFATAGSISSGVRGSCFVSIQEPATVQQGRGAGQSPAAPRYSGRTSIDAPAALVRAVPVI
jgi:hypothetical protein